MPASPRHGSTAAWQSQEHMQTRRKRGRAVMSAAAPGGSDAGSDAGSPPAAAPRRVRARQGRKPKPRAAAVKSAGGGEPKASRKKPGRRRRTVAGTRSGPGITACLLHPERGLRAGGVRNHLRPSLLSEAHMHTAGVGLGMCHACFMWSLRHYGLDRQPHLHCYRHHDGEQVLASKCRDRIERLRALGIKLREMDGACGCAECAGAKGAKGANGAKGAKGAKGAHNKKSRPAAAKSQPRAPTRPRARSRSITHVAGGSGSADDDSSVCSGSSGPSAGSANDGSVKCVETTLQLDVPHVLRTAHVEVCHADQHGSEHQSSALHTAHHARVQRGGGGQLHGRGNGVACDNNVAHDCHDGIDAPDHLVEAGLDLLLDDAADAALAVPADMSSFLDGLFDLPLDHAQQHTQPLRANRLAQDHPPPTQPRADSVQTWMAFNRGGAAGASAFFLTPSNNTLGGFVVPRIVTTASGAAPMLPAWASYGTKALCSSGVRTAGGTPCSTHPQASSAWGVRMSPPGGVESPYARLFSSGSK